MNKIKHFSKDFLGKLPVFLFCVAFISMHNYFFGMENNIIAVIILTGLFMFMRGDFGYNPRQAALMIPCLFVLIVISARLSFIHPVVGLLINLITIFLLLTMSCHDLTQGNHIPLLMGYLFCQGYNVSGVAFRNRLISIVIGSILIALLYYLINRKNHYRRNIKNLFTEIDIHSTRTQWYIRMTITLSLSIFICELLNYPRTMWIALPILSLTTPFEDEHFARSKARIPAAILGTAIFYLLFVVLIPTQYQFIFVLGAGFAAMFIQNYFIKSIYNSFSALGAAVILFPTSEALWLRIQANIIGTIIALVSYYLFRQIYRRPSLRKH